MKKVQCIIVGSGLAGISIAWELFLRKVSFIIISSPPLSHASLIAPGVWNPIVFKRIVPTWNASELIKSLLPFYSRIEKILKKQLIYPLKIWHAINNTEEEKLWKQKQVLYPRFLKDIFCLSKENYPYLKENIKCGEVNDAGRLNISEYIFYSIELFKSINAYAENYFNYDALITDTDQIIYDNILAEKVVFCEGYLVKTNPFFNFVKLKPAKGELIEIECQHPILPENSILHRQINIIPTGNKKYIIGSNYEWQQLDEQATTLTKDKFLLTFKQLFHTRYQLIGHYAGIRPASDRRPILGNHHKHNNIYIFNGLGTKGVMLAPYCTKILSDNILHNRPIENSLNVSRFFI